MHLTRFTDLSLRLVMRLAVVDPASASPTTRGVAAQIGVPYTHAAKAVSMLRTLGVVETRRGRGGGLAITDFGREVSLGWLTRKLEGDGEVVECDGATPCPLRDGCRLRGALRRAQTAFFAELDDLTLTDLTRAPTGPILISLAINPAR